jgi:hypothetical protein
LAGNGAAATLGNRELGARGSPEDEVGEDGYGKSAMKKREGFDSNEAVLTWPQSGPRDSALQNIAGFFLSELVYAWKACGTFEWIALGYLAFSSTLITIFARNLAHPARLVITQTVVAALILILCSAAVRSEQRAILHGETFATRIWHFENGQIEDFKGPYAEYLTQKETSVA